MGRQLIWKNRLHRSAARGWHPEKTLTEAIADRDRFLEKHPEYRSYQREIDRILDKAGSPEKRLTVLAVMMESKLTEMCHQLQSLNKILLTAASRPN